MSDKPNFVLWPVGVPYNGGRGYGHKRYTTRHAAVIDHAKVGAGYEIKVWYKKPK